MSASFSTGRKRGVLCVIKVYFTWCGKSVYRLELRIGFQDTTLFLPQKINDTEVAAVLTRTK